MSIATLTQSAAGVLMNQSAVAAALTYVPVGQMGSGAELLGQCMAQINVSHGDAFISQLHLSRRLVRAGESWDATLAQYSLGQIGQKVPKNHWASLVNQFVDLHIQERFVSPDDFLTRQSESLSRLVSPTINRGSHWRLMNGGDSNRQEIETALAPLQRRLQFKKEKFDPMNDDVVAELLKGHLTRYRELLQPVARSNMGIAENIGNDPRRPLQQDFVWGHEGMLADGTPVVVSIVADGFGPDGHKVSQSAAESFSKRFYHLMLLEPTLPVLTMIAHALQFADENVSRFYPNGGTTFCAFVQVGTEQYFINIGNSRGAFLSDDLDWTEVAIAQSVDDGKPLRFLGYPSAKQETNSFFLPYPDIFVKDPRVGGLVYLASDGLSWADDFDALSVLTKSSSFEAAARALIAQALQPGRRTENMAVSLIRVRAISS
ncbi:MAG: hypothetical protein Q7T03_02980 [Deltaproteobacteria bacterium]|nr:hypothetical protein [Deltaproteobacteria bacterium]